MPLKLHVVILAAFASAAWSCVAAHYGYLPEEDVDGMVATSNGDAASIGISDAGLTFNGAIEAGELAATPAPCLARPVAPCDVTEPADTALWGSILAGKRTCDAVLGWICGEFQVEVDPSGCPVSFRDLNQNSSAEFAQCVLRQLSRSRFPCAAASSQRSYESCALL